MEAERLAGELCTINAFSGIVLFSWHNGIIYLNGFLLYPKLQSFFIIELKSCQVLFNPWKERSDSQQEPNFTIAPRVFNTACLKFCQTSKNRNKTGTFWPFSGCLAAVKQQNNFQTINRSPGSLEAQIKLFEGCQMTN